VRLPVVVEIRGRRAQVDRVGVVGIQGVAGAVADDQGEVIVGVVGVVRRVAEVQAEDPDPVVLDLAVEGEAVVVQRGIGVVRIVRSDSEPRKGGFVGVGHCGVPGNLEA